jgi:hypothetical protein
MLLARPLLIGKGLYLFFKTFTNDGKGFFISLFLSGERQKELSNEKSVFHGVNEKKQRRTSQR